ncbi:MAG TPA: hypothetical protein ENJ45_04980, partial [Phaeodactylibacter sp.]|nr:hypothetical protein [Phaeodactylibacter sp.]
MKNLAISFILLFLFCASNSLEAQKYERRQGYWTLGLNAGAAYLYSDIDSEIGGGAGLTLSKNIFYRKGAPFLLDLRGRILYDKTYGQNYFRTYGIDYNPALQAYKVENGGKGYAFENHETEHGELGIEAVIAFNRLREKSRFNLALFGGIGLDAYSVSANQQNSDYQAYDYSLLNPDDDNGSNILSLNQLMDYSYETDIASKVDFMPSVGFEIGYQFLPRFSMGLSHKWTFTKTDLFDGTQWTDNSTLTGDDDVHNYTNLHMRFILQKKKKNKAPTIELITPYDNPHTTDNPLAILKAKIKHIHGAANIHYLVNGEALSFNFSDKVLNSDFYLQEGRNTVDITATNAVGSARERILIFYKTNQPPVVIHNPVVEEDYGAAPRIDITRPVQDPYYSSRSTYKVKANILNVDSRRDVRFFINGRSTQGFSFSYGKVAANVPLEIGRNNIEILVENDYGQDRDEVIIYFEEEETTHCTVEPVVKITSISDPKIDPCAPEDCFVKVKATVKNVESEEDISVFLDGNRIWDFDYSFYQEELTCRLILSEGEHLLRIIARNDIGSDEDREQIIGCNYTPDCIDPKIDITAPTYEHTKVSSINLKATAKEIESKNQISLSLNGRRIHRFDFRPRTGRINANLTLTEGINTIVLKASNDCGEDYDEFQIEYKREVTPTKTPPIVNISSPHNSTETDRSTIALTASIQHVM